jgi:hypothetical protein
MRAISISWRAATGQVRAAAFGTPSGSTASALSAGRM